jgi:signal peptidase I
MTSASLAATSGRLAGRLVAGATWTILFLTFAFLAAVAAGPHLLGYETEAVLSGSMVPTFSPGDAVLVTSEPASAVRVGQIISYHIPIGDHHVETHRIVKIISAGAHPVVVTKGDANSAVDPWQAKLIAPRVWHVRTVLPHVGTIVHVMRGRLPHLLTTLVAPMTIVALLLVRIWAPRREAVPSGAT